MKILIVYASNSGSTYLVANQLREVLRAKHAVTVKKAAETTPDMVQKYPVVLLGSPSWSVEGHEGYPQETILRLMREMENIQYDGRRQRWALFGCGDTSYTFFCGAVDHLEHFVRSFGGESLLSPLKIDGYFFTVKESEKAVAGWAKKLIKAL